METLGQRIRRLREERRWSQSELADMLGVSQRTVGNWENGRNDPRNSLGALEKVLGQPLSGEGEDQPASGDPVVAAVQRSPLTEDRQYDVIGFYKRKLREQEYEDEGRRGA